MKTLPACLLILLLLSPALRAAEPSTQPAPLDPTLTRAIEALRTQLACYRTRSAAWVDLAQFDRAAAELDQAQKSWQSILILTRDLPPALTTPLLPLPPQFNPSSVP